MRVLVVSRRAIALAVCQLLILQPLAFHAPVARAECQVDGNEGLSNSDYGPGENPESYTWSSSGDVAEDINAAASQPSFESNFPESDNGDAGSGDATAGDPGGTDSAIADDGGTESDASLVDAFEPFDPGDLFGESGADAPPLVDISPLTSHLYHIVDPIDTRTGNKFHIQVDYRSWGRAPLKFARVYNSLPTSDQANKTVDFGLGWRTNYDRSLQYVPSPAQVTLHRPNGSLLVYTPAGGGVWQTSSPGGVLTQVSSGWQYINNRNTIEYYDANGRLTAMSQYGLTITLSYDAAGRLSQVANPFGRALQFQYNAGGRVSSVVLPGGQTLQYTYSGGGNLTAVTFADGTTRQYLYEVGSNPRLLTGIIDEAGRRYVTWGYDSAGRATSSQFAGGTNSLTIAYAPGVTTTTDHRGVQRERDFQTFGNGKMRMTRLTTRSAAGVRLVPDWTFRYDAQGVLQSVTTRRGEDRTYSFDSRGRITSATRAAGTSIATTRTRQWHPQFRIPSQSVARGVTTTRQVDSTGRITQSTRTGTDGLSVTSSFAYNTQGMLSQVTGPSGQMTSYTYDGAGNTASVTTAAGHVTQFLAYNAHGQPTQIRLPDGRLVDRLYDARGRLISRTVAGRTTNFQYDAAGRMTQVTLPDGRYLAYAYDGARRLSSVTNERSERLSYTRDAGGEVTAAVVTDALGNVAAQRSRELNLLARTAAVVGAMGNARRLPTPPTAIRARSPIRSVRIWILHSTRSAARRTTPSPAPRQPAGASTATAG